MYVMIWRYTNKIELPFHLTLNWVCIFDMLKRERERTDVQGEEWDWEETFNCALLCLMEILPLWFRNG